MNATYIIMALLSVMVVIENKALSSSLTHHIQKPNKPIEAIKEIVARKVKWLNEAVRILVNSSKWIFNRSAFWSG
jgi:hypothetical protein